MREKTHSPIPISISTTCPSDPTGRARGEEYPRTGLLALLVRGGLWGAQSPLILLGPQQSLASQHTL